MSGLEAVQTSIDSTSGELTVISKKRHVRYSWTVKEGQYTQSSHFLYQKVRTLLSWVLFAVPVNTICRETGFNLELIVVVVVLLLLFLIHVQDKNLSANSYLMQEQEASA